MNQLQILLDVIKGHESKIEKIYTPDLGWLYICKKCCSPFVSQQDRDFHQWNCKP